MFNIADASISIGVAVLIVGMWLSGRDNKAEAEPAAETSRSVDAVPGDNPGQGAQPRVEARDEDENARLPGRESL